MVVCGRTHCGGGHCFTFLKPPCQQAVKAIHPPCARAFEYTYLIAFPEQDKTATEKQYLSLFICLDLVCTLAVYKYSY
jgi:hypothetical protein